MQPPDDPNKIPWFLIFLGTIWLLWKARNKRFFYHKETSGAAVSKQALALARETTRTLPNEAITIRRRLISASWTPSSQGQYKLNTGGSRNNITGMASAGGLIRDSEGNWIRGFTVNIGQATTFAPEL